jgi:WD40 repeat protein
MNCQKCLHSPSFLCHCSNVYICDLHFGSHIASEGNHKFERLASTISPSEKSLLFKKLQNNISHLQHLKSTILKETKTLINFIEKKTSEKILKINQEIKNYCNFFIQRPFQTLKIEEIKKISSTELILETFDTQMVKKMVDKLFSKNLIVLESDSRKIKEMKTRRFLQTHNGGFNCLVISKDGKTLVTGSQDASVRLWDFADKRQVACLTDHKSTVWSLALSSNSSLLVSGSSDRTVILWDVEKRYAKTVFNGHSGAVYTVAFSKDNNNIISGSGGQEIIIWKISSNQNLKILTDDVIWCGIFSSKNLYFSGIGSNLTIWDLSTSKKLESIEGHDSDIRSIAITSNNHFIITSSDDTFVKIWEMRSKKLYGTLKQHTAAVCSVSITPDDLFIVSGSCDQTIIIWKISSRSFMHKFSFHDDHVYAVSVFNDLIFSVSRDSRIGISKVSTIEFQNFFSVKPFKVGSESIKDNLVAFGSLDRVALYDLSENSKEIIFQGHLGPVQSVSISFKLDFLISASTGDSKNLLVWDLSTKSLKATLVGHETSVFCIDISSNDLKAISGDFNGTVRLWDLSSFRQEFLFFGHTACVYSVKFSKGGNFAASGGSDRKVFVWDVINKVLHACFDGHEETVWKVLFTEDQMIVSAGLYDGVRVWSLTEKRLKNRFKDLSEAGGWLELNEEMKGEMIRYLF